MQSFDVERYYSPVARLSYVRPRLELAPSAAEERTQGIVWSEVEDAARSALRQLETDVESRQPNVRASIGAVSGGAVKVFSYCALSLPSRHEALVVGITLAAVENGFLLTADVTGEDSGQVFLQETPRSLQTKESRLVAEAVGNLATRLTRRVDEIVAALCAEENTP